jgi:hypothetical protein
MNNEKLTLDGVAYEIRQLVLGDVLDLLGKEGANFGLELIKRAVLLKGQPIGEGALSLPLRHFTALSKVVNKLNGNEETEGND